MKKSVLISLLLMSSICLAEFEFTTKSTPEIFETGELGSISVIVTGDGEPFKVTVNGKIIEDVDADEEVDFGGLGAGTYTVTVEDEEGTVQEICVPVLSDNSILNFIIQKYCSTCTTI